MYGTTSTKLKVSKVRAGVYRIAPVVPDFHCGLHGSLFRNSVGSWDVLWLETGEQRHYTTFQRAKRAVEDGTERPTPQGKGGA